MDKLPGDVQIYQVGLKLNPKLATSHANPLLVNLPKPLTGPTPTKLKIPILIYHYIEYVKDPKDKIRLSLNIQPWLLEQQIKTLKQNGFTFLTPSDIPDILTGKTKLPARPIILSFDDGYRDFYTDAFPILKKYQARAINYVVPGFLDLPNNLTHQQLAELNTSSLIEIGAHTVSHAYLKGLNKKRVEFEVRQSKIALEHELKKEIVSFAYPYGAFDLQAVQVVKEAGFKTAVTTLPGVEIHPDNLLLITRIRAGNLTGEGLIHFLEHEK